MSDMKVYVDVDAHLQGWTAYADRHYLGKTDAGMDRQGHADTRRASMKLAGRIRIPRIIRGQQSYLFYEVNKWFVERKTA